MLDGDMTLEEFDEMIERWIELEEKEIREND